MRPNPDNQFIAVRLARTSLAGDDPSAADNFDPETAKATTLLSDDTLAHQPETSATSSGSTSDNVNQVPSLDKESNPPMIPAEPRIRNHHLLVNLWIVAVMGGILAIICVGKQRFEEPEPGEAWHAVSRQQPFLQSLEGSPPYVQAVVVLPPWEYIEKGPDGTLVEGPGQGARHRLLRNRRRGLMSTRAGAAGRLSRRLHQGMPLMTSLRRQLSSGGGDLPLIRFFIGQPTMSVASTLHQSARQGWVPISDDSECRFDSVRASECFFEVRDVVRLNDSAPAVAVLMLEWAGGASLAVPAYIEVTQMGQFGKVKEWIALIIVALTLLGIAVEKVHRMWVAFIAAFAMTGLLLLADLSPPLAEVVSWIDYGTMGLLVGMMMIVGQLQLTGFFEVICAACLRLSGGSMSGLTVLLGVMTAFISAWLDNVTTMLLMAPMTMAVFKVLGRNPVPLLMAQAMLSNVGGTATMIGDPPNIIIGNALRQELGFMDFLIHLAPGIILAVPFSIGTAMLLYRKELTGRLDAFEQVMSKVERYSIRDWQLMARSGYVTLLVVVGFLLHPVHHLNPAWIALLGATVLTVVVEPHNAHIPIHMVEWDMLLFFAGMFIMVEGAVELGLIRRISQLLTLLINTAPPESQKIAAIQVIIWFSALFSAVLDNIPYTITMLPVIEDLAAGNAALPLSQLAWALAFGACLGGNGTLIGASANIVTAGLANRAGHHIGFVSWLRAGVPITIVSTAVANVYMLLRYCT